MLGGEFSNNPTIRHAYIWHGNMRTAEVLIDASKEDPYERSILIYPILFNYRHAIELAMKWIIKIFGHYSAVQPEDLEHHNLWKL